MRNASALVALVILAGCAKSGEIVVTTPEIYNYSSIASQSDELKKQLLAGNPFNVSALAAAGGNIQGGSARRSNVSLNFDRGGANGAASGPSAADNTITFPQQPTLSVGTAGSFEQQVQLASMISMYDLLLSGSSFSKYTVGGEVRDRIVVGFPITIIPSRNNKNMAAEVQVTYFPPNPGQYRDPQLCLPLADMADKYARNACQNEESVPTIINILPDSRSYNTVRATTDSGALALGALVGTMNIGASGFTGRTTEYFVAEADTIAMQLGTRTCTKGKLVDDAGVSTDASAGAMKVKADCPEAAKGVAFAWQFRPVLGDKYVRPGLRRVYVQLAIPYALRPYPHYGGHVVITTGWRKFDADTGLAQPGELMYAHRSYRDVFGETFVAARVAKISVADVGGGSILVTVSGKFMNGSKVRIGTTVLDPRNPPQADAPAAASGVSATSTGKPSVVAAYDTIRFITTLDDAAKKGVSIISSEDVDTPLDLPSMCKAWEAHEECEPKKNKFHIDSAIVTPQGDTRSLVHLEVSGPFRRNDLYYNKYFSYEQVKRGAPPGERTASAKKHFAGPKPTRRTWIGFDNHPVPDTDHEYTLAGYEVGNATVNPEGLGATLGKDARLQLINDLPLVVLIGNTYYGLSDHPFKAIKPDYVQTNQHVIPSRRDGELTYNHAAIDVVVKTDSIQDSPVAKVKRLFGDPADDSDLMSFSPPAATDTKQKKISTGSAKHKKTKAAHAK